MLSTLARVGEITQARWAHIDFNAGTWTIPPGNSKNAKMHTIHLSGFALRHFEELRELHHWSDGVLPSTKKHGHHVYLKGITQRIGDAQRATPRKGRTKATCALILANGDWTPHDLRRTGATIMRNLRTNSDVIERCLNHPEQNKLVKVYQRADLSGEMHVAWLRLGEQLDEILTRNERKVLPFRRVA